MDDYAGELIGELIDALDPDEIGRRGRKRRQARRAGRKLAKGRTAGNKLAPGSQRLRTMGLGSISVPAGGTAILSVNVQKAIQISRLTITPAAVGILVMDIRIGVNSQFTTVEGMPAEVFGPTATHVGVEFDPAMTGNQFSVTFSNPTGAAIVVGGAAFGVAAD